MKTVLLITTALVALGAGPVFAAGTKTMQSSNAAVSSDKTMNSKAAMNSGKSMRSASAQGGLVQAPNGGIVKPPRAQQDARERPVTQQLNQEAAQAAAGGTAPMGATRTSAMQTGTQNTQTTTMPANQTSRVQGSNPQPMGSSPQPAAAGSAPINQPGKSENPNSPATPAGNLAPTP
jgi:hypothetical protein